MGSYMRRKAYAKVTLCLHVEKRVNDDLYFRNITVPIDLFDVVYLDISDTLTIETDKKFLPNDNRNTVYKAINLMKEKYSIKENFKVRIVKNIPAQSGLGGGSADAACVIRMIDEMMDLKLSRDELIEIASEIDEDTPYCLFNEPAIVGGQGEALIPIVFPFELHYLLIKPSYGISTKGFMKTFKNFSTPERFDDCLKALQDGDYELLVRSMHNDFQRTALTKHSGLRRIIQTLKRGKLDGIIMSGTGSSMFGLTRDIEELRKFYESVALEYSFVKYGRINPIECRKYDNIYTEGDL